MSVCRVEKSKNYTVMSNYHLTDRGLSLKAAGLLSKILSLPEDWDYTIEGLASICREGKDAVRSAVEELEAAGYIIRRQTHSAAGTFAGNEYIIYEYPHSADSQPLSGFPTTVNPSTDNPSSEKPSTENPTELNTNIQNTKELSTNIPPKAPRSGRRSLKKEPDWKPERFAGLWKCYPRGENKQLAIAEWDKLRADDDTINAMARALIAQKKTEDWQNGIGIPHLCRWLKNRRWEDEKPAGEEEGLPVWT